MMSAERFSDSTHREEVAVDTTRIPTCPRCRSRVQALAHFCGSCGLVLPSPGESGVPGQIADPRAAQVPAGFAKCADAADLYFKWESAWGDSPMLGTEPLAIQVFNRGYGLAEVELMIRVFDRSDVIMVETQRSIGVLKRGKVTTVELHSFELERPVGRVEVGLVSAEFDRSQA